MPDTYVNAERLGYFKDKVDEKIEADLSSKADKTGSYPDLTAGNAAQLIGTVYTEDKAPYKFRTTGGSIDVGNRADDTIVGGSVVWNQNLEGDFSNPDNWGDISGQSTHSIANVVLTVTAATAGSAKGVRFNKYKFISDHVYLTRGYVKSSGNTTIRVGATSAAGGAVLVPKVLAITESNTSIVYDGVLKIGATSATGIFIYTDANNQQAVGDTVELSKWQLFDLTQMFDPTIADYIYSLEQTTAGAGVAWFRKFFPDDYYHYNPGEIMSVSGLTSHDMVGFNLFDKTASYKAGSSYRYIDTLIGNSNELHMEFVDKDTSVNVSGINIGFVNINDGLVPSRFRWVMQNGVINANKTNIASQDVSVYCPYVFVYPQSDDAWDRLNRRYDICVNLSWSGYRNGEYEPYVKHSYPLDSTLTLRGIPKLDSNNNLYYDGDTYESDGTVTRKYGIVDLGTLWWTKTADERLDVGYYFFTNLTSLNAASAFSFIIQKGYEPHIREYLTNILTNKGSAIDKIAFSIPDVKNFYVIDSSYTDAETFKAAMSGVYLVYELATPITETAAPYTNPQIIDDFGTEEYVTDSIVPVGHVTKYPENLRDKLQHLPDLASIDGTYLLTQSNKKMSLSPYVAPTIPAFPTPDTTLTVEGGYAEAKTVGDEITGLKEDLNGIETELFTISDNFFNIDDIYTDKVPGSVGSSYDTMVTLNGWYTSNYIPVTEGEQYALVYLNTITQGAIFRIVGYSNGIMTYKTSDSTEPNPFTIPSGVDHVRFYSNTTNLFNKRTNTSFKKYSADMSMAWTPYGKQENFLVKGAMPEYGVYVDGTNYYHFVRFGEKTLIRHFKQDGPNNLFQFSALYTGEVSEHGVSIDKTIAINRTDTVGPISIMRQGVDSGGMWTGGWHTRTVNSVICPTAEQQSLDIKINGESIVGVDGLHYGECVATVVNKLYFPQTIADTDLSTATQAIQETVTYILNEKMTARVAHKYVADTRVILYYGMQAVRIGFNNILLPNNETAFAFADMTANINLDKPEDLMQMSNDDWNYDLIIKPFGLAKYTHNSGAGTTKYGYLPTATRKVYWALMEGTYDYTFITSGKVLVWEGVWDIYPN